MSVRSRLVRAAAVLVAGLAVLAACSGLPTSGPVNPGVPADEVPDEPFLYYPGGPEEDATPEQIVSGFVEAATSPAGDWSTAREFLTPEFASEWEPDAHVTIDVPSGRGYDDSRLDEEGIIDLSVEPVATVDTRGIYRTAEQSETELAFELVEQDDGQWRISRAPAGIVLDRDHFPNVYSDFTLFFYDATWQRLVPDVRWYPEGTTETRIVNELLLGAGPYTEGGVKSAVPTGTRLATGGVTVGDDGSAEITLSAEAGGTDAGVAARMTTQLSASLESVGVQSVRIRVGDEELSAEEFEPMPTKLDARALVLADTGHDSGFGFLDAGGAIDTLDAGQQAIDRLGESPTALSLSADRQTVIAQTRDGDVWRLTSDGGDRLDQRDGLIEPTLDPQGYPWSVVGDSPKELTSYTPEFQPLEIENAFAGVRRVYAMSVSPDGSRMAASVSTASGAWIVVIPILRESDGTPSGMGDPVPLTRLDGRGTAVSWLDSSTVGVVARDTAGQQVIYQQIGGPATRMASEPDIVAIEAGSQQSLGRILAADGTLYVRRGSVWQEAATGVKVLASQLGAPTG